jgi:hypothetical protein
MTVFMFYIGLILAACVAGGIITDIILPLLGGD